MSYVPDILFMEPLFDGADTTRFSYSLPVRDWPTRRAGVISTNIPIRCTHEEVLVGSGSRGLEIS